MSNIATIDTTVLRQLAAVIGTGNSVKVEDMTYSVQKMRCRVAYGEPWWKDVLIRTDKTGNAVALEQAGWDWQAL